MTRTLVLIASICFVSLNLAVAKETAGQPASTGVVALKAATETDLPLPGAIAFASMAGDEQVAQRPARPIAAEMQSVNGLPMPSGFLLAMVAIFTVLGSRQLLTRRS